jgi:hypothetical protein
MGTGFSYRWGQDRNPAARIDSATLTSWSGRVLNHHRSRLFAILAGRVGVGRENQHEHLKSLEELLKYCNCCVL